MAKASNETTAAQSSSTEPICEVCKHLMTPSVVDQRFYCETDGCEVCENYPEAKLLRQIFGEPEPLIIYKK
jgi:hypothetical protein